MPELDDEVVSANDGEVPIRRMYARYPESQAALRRWVDARSQSPGPYRPRFMVYSGLGSPQMTADRLAALQQLGAESFLIAADLPSQLGFDPDHELSFAQVGRAGVSCSTLDDFHTICSGLDLAAADSIGLLANSVGHIGLAMVDAVLRDRGARDVRLVMQNDPLKEFTARGTEIHTPQQALRIACDCVAYAIDEQLPGAAITVCSNHLDVAGAGPVVGLALAFANAQAYVDELVGRGYAAVDVLDKMMFFVNERSDLYVTASLFRTARVIWSELVRQRYGVAVSEQPVMRLMGYAHGLESAEEPLVNVPRITLSVLGSMMGGADYLCASAYDEALRIPSLDAAALALRTMEVVGYEHGALASIDALQGSHKIDAVDDYIRDTVMSELGRVDAVGGAVAAIERGYIKQRIDERRGTRERQLERGDRAMVGHNVFASADHRSLFAGHSTGELAFGRVEEEVRLRLKRHKERRDDHALQQALAAVEEAAAGTGNLVPPTSSALRAGATAQEVVSATQRGFDR